MLQTCRSVQGVKQQSVHNPLNVIILLGLSAGIKFSVVSDSPIMQITFLVD